MMNAVGARFVTITAYQLPGDEGIPPRISLGPRRPSARLSLSDQSRTRRKPRIESIYDLCEAADWIEREMHEEYAIDFTGRDYEPLLLREGDKLGVNLREIANTCKPDSGLRQARKRSQNELQNPHGPLPSRPSKNPTSST